MTPPDPQGAETPDFGVTFKCEAKPEHVHNHPLFDLHEETLAYLTGVVDAYPEMPGREQYAYAAQCVKDVQALRGELDKWREREAAVCPEDFGFEEVIAALRAENARLTEQVKATEDAKQLMLSIIEANERMSEVFGADSAAFHITRDTLARCKRLLAAAAQATGRTDAE